MTSQLFSHDVLTRYTFWPSDTPEAFGMISSRSIILKKIQNFLIRYIICTILWYLISCQGWKTLIRAVGTFDPAWCLQLQMLTWFSICYLVIPHPLKLPNFFISLPSPSASTSWITSWKELVTCWTSGQVCSTLFNIPLPHRQNVSDRKRQSPRKRKLADWKSVKRFDVDPPAFLYCQSTAQGLSLINEVTAYEIDSFLFSASTR